MTFYQGTENLPPSEQGHPTVLALGNFDGIHLGHQVLLKTAQERAKELGLRAYALSFDPHPMSILRPPHQRLISTQEQGRLIEGLGLQGLIHLKFDETLQSMQAEDFLESILERRFQPKVIVVGFNFRFGYQRQGTPELLEAWCKSKAIDLVVIKPVSDNNHLTISTTKVREALNRADFKLVEQLLGRAFMLSSTVVQGDGRGAGLGFPTANLVLPPEVIPPDGVYATWAITEAGEKLLSATHIGNVPTFDKQEQRIETFLLGFHGSIYGQKLKLVFVEQIRGVQKFNSSQELVAQIKLDIQQAEKILKRLHA